MKSCDACGGQRTQPVYPSDPGQGRWAHARCDDCGLLFVDPLPTGLAALNSRLYGAPGGERARPVTSRTQRWLKRLRAQSRREAAPRFLDVGCGSGAVVGAAAQAGFAAQGVELEEAVAAGARARGLDVITGELSGLPRDATYHRIRMNQLLEHVVSPRELLEQARDRLAPGGSLHVVTPNAAGRAHQVLGAAWRHLGGEHNGHLALFGPQSLRRSAQRAGLELVEVSTRGLRAWSRRHPHGVRRLGWRLAEQALRLRLGDQGDELVAVLQRL